MLSHVTGFPSFLKLNNIPMYVWEGGNEEFLFNRYKLSFIQGNVLYDIVPVINNTVMCP